MAQLETQWPRAAFGVAGAYAALLVVVYARPGLPAVVLWYVGPPLLALATAAVLAVAFAQSWRARAVPARPQIAGFATLAAVIVALGTFRAYPSSHGDRPSDVRFRLPLDGPVTVAWGGPTLAANYHAVMPDQRWAYDLLVATDGRSYDRDGTRLEHYFAYGRAVRAPADGIVHTVHDGEPDEPIGHWQVRRPMGNYVILEVAPREYLFMAHFQRGSIAPARGARVRAGDVIGRVGNSGNASEPHVHLHLQDTPDALLGEGIPMYFHDYRARGVLVERGMPAGGRTRRSRWWPGRFIGDTVEQAPPLRIAGCRLPIQCRLTTAIAGSLPAANCQSAIAIQQ